MTLSADNRRLVSNTAFLYILVFSSQLLNLATIPYQTRVLGPSCYGVVGAIVGIMGLVTIILDFGFLLSATKRISEVRDDQTQISKIMSSVLGCKMLLVLVLCVAGLAATFAVQVLVENRVLFVLYLAAYSVSGMLPDFVYRGIEDMKAITIRTVCVRVFCAALIFVFLRGPEDVFVLPLLLLAGNALAALYSFYDLKRRFKIVFLIPKLNSIIDCCKESLPYFGSRFASTAYQSLNAVLLGAVYPGNPVVGYYTSADKFMSLVKTASSPVADSLFPYMTRNKNYRLCKRILLLSCLPIALLGFIAFVFAPEICAVAFGEEYRDAGQLLRCLLPAMLVIFPTYIICFPILVPMGLSKQANLSTGIGALIQISLIVVLTLSGNFSAVNLCISASVSEVSVFLYRLFVMLKYWDRTQLSIERISNEVN